MTTNQKTNLIGAVLTALTWVQPYIMDVSYTSTRGILFVVAGMLIAGLSYYIGKK